MTKYAALPGFRDFYPEEMARRNQIFQAWRDVGRRYGFEEYDGPPLEPLDLYVEKSGPEIVNQLFNFTDKGGREVALRPEMTPTIVRMLGARIKGMPRPVRWFSMPQLFRYEKQQRGRLREHFQLNMDIVGEESVAADADLLAAALDVLRTLGLTAEDVVARYSDRRLLHAALVELGVAEADLPVAYNVIDKVERDPREVCLARLREIGLSEEGAAEALSLTDTGNFFELSKRFGGNPEIGKAFHELNEYEGILKMLGFGDWVQFDMKIVRGLAYYTGIVFEIFDRRGKLRAICGGGRYDQLFLSLTGIDIPALGFGFGDVVLGELLKDRGLAAVGQRRVDCCVIPSIPGDEMSVWAVTRYLRDRGKSVVFDYRIPDVNRFSLTKYLKYASSQNAAEAVLVRQNPEILAGNTSNVGALRVTVKNLATGEQVEMTAEEYATGERSS